MSDRKEEIHVRIDGEKWVPNNSETAEYDAIHAVAGAVLAGASEVQVIRQSGMWKLANAELSDEELENIREKLQNNE